MYRLTVSGPITTQVLKQIRTGKPIWIRMYRWANKWGEYTKETDEWTCEIRRDLAYVKTDEDQAVLEKVEQIDITTPPFQLDDMWEEEVFQQGNVRCGNLFVITGTNEEIQTLCEKYSPSLKKWVADELGPFQRKQTQTQTQVAPLRNKVHVLRKARPVCMIQTE